MINWNECAGCIHSFCFAYLSCREALSVLYAHQPGLRGGGFSTYLCSHIGRENNKIGGMSNYESTCTTDIYRGTTLWTNERKNIQCKHFNKIFVGLNEIFGFHCFKLSSLSFASMS